MGPDRADGQASSAFVLGTALCPPASAVHPCGGLLTCRWAAVGTASRPAGPQPSLGAALQAT